VTHFARLNIAKIGSLACATLLLSMAALVTGAPARAAAPACAAIPDTNPRISVTASFVEPTYYRNLARSELTKKNGRGLPTYGVTETEQSFQLRVRVFHAPDNDGAGVCFVLAEVDVAFRLNKADVYIASELKPGSCAYRVTKDHENQHVAIARRAVKRHVASLDREFSKRRYRLVRRAASGDAALAMARELVAEPTRQTLERIKQDSNREHGKLDTPENYQRETNRCDTW
jgi:hypothetical protein